jgi:CBS domain-containing protein
MASALTVKDIMKTEVVTLSAEDALDLADDIMRLGRIRHMPVVEGGRLVGILSQRDLFRAAVSSVLQFKPGPQRAWLSKIHVREVMATQVKSVLETATVQEAADLMLRERIGCLPVIGGEDGDELIGLVSESDCLALLSKLLGDATS